MTTSPSESDHDPLALTRCISPWTTYRGLAVVIAKTSDGRIGVFTKPIQRQEPTATDRQMTESSQEFPHDERGSGTYPAEPAANA